MTQDALPSTGRKNNNVGLMLLLLVVAMVGAAYAAVPLYYAFCAATGYGGTPRVSSGNAKGIIAREMSVRFDTNIDSSIALKVTPPAESTAKVGSVNTVTFTATNLTDRTVISQAGFNVTPELAGQYFNKIQCFCFSEQTLKPHETVQMPVTFFVDPDIDKDSDLHTLQAITLSYTFYAAKNKGT